MVASREIIQLDRWTDLALAPGHKVSATLRVAMRHDGTAYSLPILAVRGRDEGPTMLAVGGIHGDEFEGGEAIRRFWRAVDPARIRGTFVGVPVANPCAFEVRHRANLIEHMPQDMGGTFEFSGRGFLSGRCAAVLWEQIGVRCDAIVDLHSGGTLLSILPCAIYYVGRRSKGAIDSRKLAEETGLPILREAEARASGSLAEVASFHGIPAVATETGGEGRCEERFVNLAEAVLGRTASAIGLLATPLGDPVTQSFVRMHFVFANQGGLYHPIVGLGDIVRAGHAVGTVVDAFGAVTEEIVAPVSGVVVINRTYPSIMPGDLTIGLGETLRDQRGGGGM